MRKDEECSASPTLSKPWSDESAGSRSCRETSTDRRSRMVFSYSVRLRRRRTTRPWATRREFSTAAILPSIQAATMLISFLAGRGFAFGGMTPVLSCSRTASQRSWAPLADRVKSSWSTRNFPLVFSGPWHSRQDRVRNARTGSAAESGRPFAASCPQAPGITKRAATIQRAVLMRWLSPLARLRSLRHRRCAKREKWSDQLAAHGRDGTLTEDFAEVMMQEEPDSRRNLRS